MTDPTDYIIELIKPTKGQRGFPNKIIYRLKHWVSSINRYEFINDYYSQKRLNDKLVELGFDDPEQVAVVDLLEF